MGAARAPSARTSTLCPGRLPGLRPDSWANVCPKLAAVAATSPWRRQLMRTLGGMATRSALGPGCGYAAKPEPAIVLDPFIGAGTTAVAAEQLGRDWLGIELDPQPSSTNKNSPRHRGSGWPHCRTTTTASCTAPGSRPPATKTGYRLTSTPCWPPPPGLRGPGSRPRNGPSTTRTASVSSALTSTRTCAGSARAAVHRRNPTRPPTHHHRYLRHCYPSSHRIRHSLRPRLPPVPGSAAARF